MVARNKMDSDDGQAVINADFSVTHTDAHHSITVISGFPSRAAAESFCYFGDFDQKNNDYIVITKPDFSLHWTHYECYLASN
jgi:hypothetical protein